VLPVAALAGVALIAAGRGRRANSD